MLLSSLLWYDVGVIQNVKGCARCGGDHPGLVFRPLTRAMEPEGTSRSWQQWAPCPTNGEPIMLDVKPLTGVAKGDQRQDAPVGGVGHE